MKYFISFVVMLFGLAIFAHADPISSEIQKVDFTKCQTLKTHTQGGEWSCGGPFKGYEVYFAEGDLRQFLAYGRHAKKQRAASQTLPEFNSIFKGDATIAEIEWRVSGAGDGRRPIATIVRYYTDNGMGEGAKSRGEILVVTRLGAPDGEEACHVAYVDAVANKDAPKLARAAGDQPGGNLDCSQEPSRLGKQVR